MAHPALPSLRTEPGSLTPIGFVDEPDARHTTASSEAIEEVVQASEANRSREGRPLRVDFCHHRHNHLLSPQLFGFVVHYFDSNGERVDALENDLPIRYSLNLNLPVELQQETALVLIAELIHRQKSVRPDAEGFDVSTLDQVVQAENDRAFEAVNDALRFGWKNTVDALKSMAHSEGWDLIVRYQGDPLPTRTDVINRHRVLKDAYNSIDEVRLFVDRFVSLFGGQGRFRISGGSDEARASSQGWTGVMHISEYLSHLTRDAQVLGNGYATFHATPSPAMSLKDSSTVEVAGENEFYVVQSSSDRRLIREHTLHVRGIDQMDSPYGMSLMEPLVGSYETLKTVIEAREASLQFASGPNPTQEMIDWAQQCEMLYQRTSADFSSTLQSMYFLPLQHWDFEPGPLYFNGYEQYSE